MPTESSSEIQDSVDVLGARAKEFRSAASALDSIVQSLPSGYERTYSMSAGMYLRRAAVALEAAINTMMKLEGMSK